MRLHFVLAFGIAIARPPSALAAPDYVKSNATNFDSCPTVASNLPKPPNTTNAIDTDCDPGAVHTWHGTQHHWVFVSTSHRIQVFDFKPDPPKLVGVVGDDADYGGIELVDQGVSGRRLLVALRGSRLQTFKVAFDDPTHPTFVGAVDLNKQQPEDTGGMSACVGSNAAGSAQALGNPKFPKLVYVTNECTGGTQGSLDVVDVSGKPVVKQRMRVDWAPVGLALNPDGDALYVTNEKAGPVTKSHLNIEKVTDGVGSLMVFATKASKPFLTLRRVVNPGCRPVRVAAGTSRVWVTARGSHDVQVFSQEKLLNDTQNSRISVFQVGPQPVGIKLVDNRVLVANSDRSNKSLQPSFMVFNVSALTQMQHWGDQGKVRLEPSPCFQRTTPNGVTGFPRNIAADADRAYFSLADIGKLGWASLSTIQADCP